MKSILEVGCGPGQLASYLLESHDVQYAGFDFSEEAVRMAKTRIPGIQFFVGDARSEVPYQNNDYELIICTEVLEHVEDDLAIISRFRAGARCLCSVPSFDYESHVRWFSNDSTVRERYAAFFDDCDVSIFRSPNSDGDYFFLIDGIRNSKVALTK